MDQIYFGEKICALRKARGLTQEGLARKLGVTNQAVSKWESDQCCPDIMLLPGLSEALGISIDELFGRPAPQPQVVYEEKERIVYVEKEPEPALVLAAGRPDYDALPWGDDNVLRAVCFVGHKLVDRQEMESGAAKSRFSFHLGGKSIFSVSSDDRVVLSYTGNVDSIYSYFSVDCAEATIGGDVKAGNDVRCGKVLGHVQAGGDVDCADVDGNVSAGGDIEVGGSVGGSLNAQGDGEVGGSVGQSANCSGDLTCGSWIGGNVNCQGDVDCGGEIRGSVRAAGDVSCG